MNLFAEIETELRGVLTGLQADGALPEGLDMARVSVEPPRDASHGDMATNAAMVLAKPAGMNPRAVAELLVAELVKSDKIETAEIAGPGFVNLRLTPSVWLGLVPYILENGISYGDGKGGGKLNIEYVSANPTGPMHVGHARGAVFGDALARLLEKTGHDVLREYYINDAGSQVDVLARSALLRMREAQGAVIEEIPEGLYPGDYLIPRWPKTGGRPCRFGGKIGNRTNRHCQICRAADDDGYDPRRPCGAGCCACLFLFRAEPAR